MSATARLAAVIPVLDDAARLRRLLAELRADSHLEIVVVDGGSGDETPVVASAADKVLAAPSSRGGQLRAGVAASERDWLWFLHADTHLEASAIRTLAGCLDTPGWGFFAVRLDNRAWPYRVIEQAMKWRSFATGIATGDQGIFVHRRLLDAVGGVPDQPLMEDVELCKRLRRIAKPRRLTAAITTSCRRWERGGVLHTMVLMWTLRLRYFVGVSPEVLARSYDG